MKFLAKYGVEPASVWLHPLQVCNLVNEADYYSVWFKDLKTTTIAGMEVIQDPLISENQMVLDADANGRLLRDCYDM